MRKFTRFLSFVSLAALLTLVLSSCGAVKLTYDNGRLVDAKNGITYLNAPVCFEPAVTEDELYARCSKLKLDLYPVRGQDTSKWLSELYTGIGCIYYAEGAVTLPTLREFAPDSLTICVTQTITVGLGVITDQPTIDRLVAAIEDGEPCAIVQEGESYQLKFSSPAYEGIYYTLLYVEGTDGKNYVYDRSKQRCVSVGDVLLTYMPRSTGSSVASGS